MTRFSLIYALLSLQYLGCRSEGKGPTVAQYFVEAVDLLNRTQWRYFLPDDTDIDQDGDLSDLEVEYKFQSYLGELFEMMDHDKDNTIKEEDLRSLRLDIPELNKVIDIALENFPLKPVLLAADGNGDGFYDENDFYLPEKVLEQVDFMSGGYQTGVEIRDKAVYMGYEGVFVAKIGHNEGTVICKSLGYEGLEKILESDDIVDKRAASIKYTCDGTEICLEDCKGQYNYYSGDKWLAMGVVCTGRIELGSLRLVGGKDSASGDIFLGDKGLSCFPYRHGAHEKSQEALYEVVCRELGFPGIIRSTRRSAFTKIDYPSNMRLQKEFSCNGNETKLADCRQTEKQCDGLVGGVICETDARHRMDIGLEDLVKWPQTSEIWEAGGRFLFVADSNNDGKLSLEEITAKAKEYMTEILQLVDQTGDEHLSVEDFMSLNMAFGPIHQIIDQFFNDTIGNDWEIDLFKPVLVGQDLSQYFFTWDLDNNYDKILNAADFFSQIPRRAGERSFLIPMLDLKLDKNQDGKIQRQELRHFTYDIFKKLDVDKSGAITLEDVYILMRDNGLSCFQVGALRTYISTFTNTVETQFKKLMTYLFEQFDLDGNGLITLNEFKKLPVPCAVSRGELGPDSSPMECYLLWGHLFGTRRKIRFPDLEMNSRSNSGYGGYGSRREPNEEKTIVEKMTNAACEMLT